MKFKISFIVSFWAICLAARAQPVSVFYKFSIGSGYTLTNAYVIDTEPQEAYASVEPVVINGQTSFPPGTYGGVINGTTYGPNDLTIIGVCTSDTTTNVGVTMPQSLASALSASQGVWSNYVDYLKPFGPLPDDESTMISDLQNGSTYVLQNGYGYLMTNNPVLQPYAEGQLGKVVSIDSAQIIGTFSFSLTPILSINASIGTVTIQWLTNATGFTLAQSTNLAGGAWSDVTATPSTTNNNFSVTLPADTNALFFRLHN
jgi:hypothetical protein